MAGVKKDAAWWREYRRKKKESGEGSEAKIFELQREVRLQPKPATSMQPKSATMQPVVQPKSATATPVQPVVQPKSATATPVQPVVQPKPATVQPETAIPCATATQHEKEREMTATTQSATVQPLQPESCATASGQDAKTKIATYFATDPRTAFATLAIISFVICNTAFLAFEQQKGFVSLGYSLPVAWGIAVLFELAIEILSISVALSKHTFMRIALCLVLGSTVYTLANMVSSSAKENVLAANKKPTSLITAEQSLTALSSQQLSASQAIGHYDPKRHKNKIIYATAEFNKKGGLEDKIKQAQVKLSEEQAKYKSSEGYIRAVKQSENHSDARKIAVAWNIVLMFFLGHLIREKS